MRGRSDPSRVTTSLTQLKRAALALGVASESGDLLSWNNDPNRIKQDVLGAFDLALTSVVKAPANRQFLGGLESR